VALARTAADRLSPYLIGAEPAFVSAYGMLLLKGSIAAAHLYQAADVRDLQAEALGVASRLQGEHNAHWSAFGSTNVRIHEVSALADMHGGGRVIEAAKNIDQADLHRLPKERRASCLLDVTRGYLQGGKRDQAANTLLAADRLAPEEVRGRQMTRDIVGDLLRAYPRSGSVPAQLTAAAKTIGVVV
jgi:hypothetical protein